MGTDVYRTITGEAHFNPWYRENVALHSDVVQTDIVDIELRLHASPTILPLQPSAAFVGIEDARLYINEYDVTADLSEELRKIIAMQPASATTTWYMQGVTRYLAFIRAFGTHNVDVQNEEAVAIAYANTGSWSDKFSTAASFQKLGDRSIGWSGNLHILNYIYRYVPLLPVSIATVWRNFVQRTSTGQPQELSQLPALSLVFSEGVAPFVGGINPAFVPGGGIRYQLDVRSQNPLKESLKQIQERLRSLQQSLEKVRVNYLDPLTVAAQDTRAELQSGHTALTTTIDRLRDTVEHIAGP